MMLNERKSKQNSALDFLEAFSDSDIAYKEQILNYIIKLN